MSFRRLTARALTALGTRKAAWFLGTATLAGVALFTVGGWSEPKRDAVGAAGLALLLPALLLLWVRSQMLRAEKHEVADARPAQAPPAVSEADILTLRARYRQWEDEKLVHLLREGGLLPQVEQALYEELERRRFDTAALRASIADSRAAASMRDTTKAEATPGVVQPKPKGAERYGAVLGFGIGVPVGVLSATVIVAVFGLSGGIVRVAALMHTASGIWVTALVGAVVGGSAGAFVGSGEVPNPFGREGIGGKLRRAHEAVGAGALVGAVALFPMTTFAEGGLSDVVLGAAIGATAGEAVWRLVKPRNHRDGS